MNIAFVVLKSKSVSSFGIMYLSAALKQAGHRVRLLQVVNSLDLVRQLAASEVPDILAFSVTTGLHKCYLAMGRQAKRHFKLMTVYGGSHPTFFPEMIEDDGADAVCIGEGEHAFVELADRLQAGRSIVDVNNWWVKQAGQVHRNPLRPLEADLDRLPYPDWELYYQSNPALRRVAVRPILASRGCPHVCSYCFNKPLNDMYKGLGQPVRLRRPAAVIAEILEIVRCYRTSLVWFLDSNLGADETWLAELLDLYRAEVGLPFYCKIRPDFVDSRTADLLAKAGCTGVGIGIETADDHLRNGILRRGISRAQIVDACRLLKERKIRIMAFNMIGLPDETLAQAFETMRLNVSCGVDYAMTMILQPYPRTDMARYAVERGLFDGNFDRLDYDYYSTSALNSSEPGTQRAFENLQRLFAVGVEFPYAEGLIRRGVNLPANAFYLALFKLWHRYCFNRRFYGLGLFA